VIELLMMGVVGLVALAVVALFAGALSLACWVFLLPFRLVGLVFKGLGFLLAIPFMLVFGVVGFFIFGFGAVLFLIPFAPFALLAFLLWRWMRGRPRAAVSA
jgi:hypothetical protein